ncbi:MAG: hypothetical protein Roseis2KO_54240 [Roseivirga sp.]
MVRVKHIVTVLLMGLTVGCGSGTEKKEQTKVEKPVESKVPEAIEDRPSSESTEKTAAFTVLKGESKDLLNSYYELPHIKNWYEEEMLYASGEIPDLTVPKDLSTLGYEQLRLLRNEIFARNGYLFNDGFLRGYFNKEKWYKPIFDVDSFRIVLNSVERKLVNDLSAEEKKRKQEAFVEREGLQLLNADLITNKGQFAGVNRTILADLSKNNFSLVAANRSMPFYIYDKNAYNYIPHYITTDLYLFILHKYFGKFLENLDENYLSKRLITMVDQLRPELSVADYSDETADGALAWAETYLNLTHFALTGEKTENPVSFKAVYDRETESIMSLEGAPAFIQNELINYAELSPRGHYTKTDDLANYFKAFKWISLNGADIDKDDELRGMIALAYFIKTSEKAMAAYHGFTGVVEKIAGQEDNVSIKDLLPLLDEKKSLPELLGSASVGEVRAKLKSLDKEKIKAVLGPLFPGKENETTRLYFLSSTYSISAEVFSKLVHINGDDSRRPFPKALDMPAVFRDKTAEKIIMQEYNDGSKWTDYPGKLSALQRQFEDFDQWEHNYAFKGLKTALAAIAEQENYPGFMKTDAYNRKELSSMLSSWTHIKHDLVLYQEKPYAAEAGQGGGPPAPNHYSYVEPNLTFWQESLSLVDWLMDFQAYDNSMRSALGRIKSIGEDLLNVAEKQVSGEEITSDEYDDLHTIGGRIEYTLLNILETDHIPEREKHMGLIADVYSYNGTNLNVGVGSADDIYVVVPIKGEYYIARGAVFSFYEFQSENIYTDEKWRSDAEKRALPARPRWLSPLIHEDIMPLQGDTQFRYPGWG